jgi:hypothetical protein
MPIVNEAACRRLDLALPEAARLRKGSGHLKSRILFGFQVGQAWSLRVESSARAFGITYSRRLPELGRKA